MELHFALKLIAETEGISVLQERRLINILSDLQAYDSIPASKFIISCMINEGYIKQIQDLDEWGPDGIKLLNQFLQTTGFNQDYASLIWKSFAYAYNLVDEINENDKGKLENSSIESEFQTTPLINQEIENEPHICFKRIPLVGDVNNFVIQLSRLGYNIVYPFSAERNFAVLNGTFAGVSNCQILVAATPITGIVCSVMVCLPPQRIWSNLKNEYEQYKEKLTSKYGEPICREYFLDPYYEGDGYEMLALSSEHCSFHCFFKDQQYYNGVIVDVGTIALSLATDGGVMLAYQDAANSRIEENEKNLITHDDL